MPCRALVGVMLGYDYGSFTVVRTFLVGFKTYSLAINDFDNDTLLDIVVTNCRDDNVGILLGYGDGTFANQRTFRLVLVLVNAQWPLLILTTIIE
jgi:hypothetical protein